MKPFALNNYFIPTLTINQRCWLKIPFTQLI